MDALPGGSAGAADAVSLDPVLRLERRLRRQGRLHLTASVHAEGAGEASFDGQLLLGLGGRARIDFRGLLQGDERHPWLEAWSGWTRGGSRTRDAPAFEGDTPSDLNERLIVELTRRGVLGTLIELAGDRPPRLRADELTLRNVREGQLEGVHGYPLRRVRFEVWRGDALDAEVELRLDAATDLPVERRQIQRLGIDGQTVRVVERYLDVRLGDAVDPAELRPLAADLARSLEEEDPPPLP